MCREAALAALREDLEGATHVYDRHFRTALRAVRPALTREVLGEYASWGRARGRGRDG